MSHRHRKIKVRVTVSLRAYRRLVAELELRNGEPFVDPKVKFHDDLVDLDVEMLPEAYDRTRAEMARRRKLGLDCVTMDAVVESVLLQSLDPAPGEEPMIPAEDPLAPKYWRNESTGCLDGPIKRYLKMKPLSDGDIRLIGLYLRQWIESPVWLANPHLTTADIALITILVGSAREIRTVTDIDLWLEMAVKAGLDPL
jgi:hypothetical protein